jgi:hypothetical protein
MQRRLKTGNPAAVQSSFLLCDDLAKALLAIALAGSVSMSLCFAALRGRINKR